jgi:surfactin synthase thioesterase subunit
VEIPGGHWFLETGQDQLLEIINTRLRESI